MVTPQTLAQAERIAYAALASLPGDGELLRLLLGVLGDLLALERDLIFVHVTLRAYRDILAGGHRHGARHQAGDVVRSRVPEGGIGRPGQESLSRVRERSAQLTEIVLVRVRRILVEPGRSRRFRWPARSSVSTPIP